MDLAEGTCSSAHVLVGARLVPYDSGIDKKRRLVFVHLRRIQDLEKMSSRFSSQTPDISRFLVCGSTATRKAATDLAPVLRLRDPPFRHGPPSASRGSASPRGRPPALGGDGSSRCLRRRSRLLVGGSPLTPPPSHP